MDEEAISNLRIALQLSPENVPLRMILAQSLLSAAQYEVAEKEFKTVLEYMPANTPAKYGLARACFLQGKNSLAYVVLDELCRGKDVSADMHILFSKVLVKENMKEQAAAQYREALLKSPLSKDEELDLLFRMPQSSNSRQENEDDEEHDDASGFIEKPDIEFKDVGGMEKVKEEIRLKIIHPITHAELYKAYGKKAGGGILLYGPPGCGKTYLAKATAGEVKARFINVGINDILDMWMGNSEKKLHEIFELARRNTPCVLFFDEVDALGANRSDMKNSAGRNLINQFLSEMDGIDANNEGVLILAATNAPWHLDPAFRRPGRFDRIIFVQPPDEAAREEILKIHLKGKPVKDLDMREIATKAKDFSGADLRALIDTVIEAKLEQSFRTGIPEPIVNKDLQTGLKNSKPSTQEWFSTARNYALYSNESGLYNDILDYLKLKK